MYETSNDLAPTTRRSAVELLNEHLAGATFADDGPLGYPRVMSPDRRPYRTADGWIAVLPYLLYRLRS